MEVASRLLVGDRPAPALLDASGVRDLDLHVEVLEDEIGAVCTNEQWGEIYDRVADLARKHRSTIVFVNTRRLVERLALHLGERLGADAVAAHHGSLSRARRFSAEQRLKSGQLKAIVATASLELGIDVGRGRPGLCRSARPVPSPPACSGWAAPGHAVGGTPKGRFFPLTRDQLCECAALVRAARRGELDRIALRDAPLDILAQQIVALCAAEEWDEDALYALVPPGRPLRRAAPGSASTPWSTCWPTGSPPAAGAAGALLHRDGVNRRLRGRRGARLAAMTSGGAIPDTRPLRGRARARGHGGGHGRGGLRHREHGGRRLPAGQHLLADPAGRERPGAGGRRGRRRPHHPLLAGGGARPAPASCRSRWACCARRSRSRAQAEDPDAVRAWLRAGLCPRRRRGHPGARLRAGRPGGAGGDPHADLRGGRAVLRRERAGCRS